MNCNNRDKCIGLEQGWPTQLHHWANILVSLLKRPAKLPIAISLYFTSIPSNFFDDLFLENLIPLPPLYLPKAYPPSQIFPPPPPTKFAYFEKNFLPKINFLPLKKGVELDNSNKGRTDLPSGPHA